MDVGHLSVSHIETLREYDQPFRLGDLRNPLNIYTDVCPECGGADLYASRLNLVFVAGMPDQVRPFYERVRRGHCADCGWAGYAQKARAAA